MCFSDIYYVLFSKISLFRCFFIFCFLSFCIIKVGIYFVSSGQDTPDFLIRMWMPIPYIGNVVNKISRCKAENGSGAFYMIRYFYLKKGDKNMRI